MYSLNKTYKYLCAIAICLFATMSSIAHDSDFNDYTSHNISIQVAEKNASKEYRKYTKNKIKKFTCRFIRENQETWAFGCEEVTKRPRPGGVLFVNIDKVSGKATIYPGQ